MFSTKNDSNSTIITRPSVSCLEAAEKFIMKENNDARCLFVNKLAGLDSQSMGPVFIQKNMHKHISREDEQVHSQRDVP